MAVLTIFSAPKPFMNPHIALIQRNAIRSWQQWGDQVEVILVGKEDGLEDVASQLGVILLPDVDRNQYGTPQVSSIFALARENSTSPLLAYVNADILLLLDFLDTALLAVHQLEKFLLVGQRYDLEIRDPIVFTKGWQDQLNKEISAQGRMHPRGGSDYFIFPHPCFSTIPRFAIGRAGWDNWMIYEARRQYWPVVDATGSITIIHQEHNYSHLPGGQPHYRLPETDDNIRLAGGKRRIFDLGDADFHINGGRIQRNKMTWGKFWREVEIFPLIHLRSYTLAQLAYVLFHPKKSYREGRAWLRRRFTDQDNHG